MSVQSEIDRISANIAGAYSAVEDMGGALPEEQVSGNLEAAVRSIPVNGGSETSGEIYSTEEQVIGTWIDGKPLCRKTLLWNDFIGYDGSQTCFYLSAEKLINYYGAFLEEGSDHYIQIPYCSVADFFGVSAVFYPEYEEVDLSYKLENVVDFFLTVEYTKTTD